ncbi:MULTISPECIES: AraC family transcriptional regulator [Lacticaseibacillus]|uniref:AraC family transcriptional regulator n=1 Tax=Lacticaseibacillus hegangensis TaxID=2486010 RepID=A0ABW4CUQ8_9LACO|nr:AraC family transcriptional regulator [Lacticaseibacillus sp. 53-4]
MTHSNGDPLRMSVPHYHDGFELHTVIHGKVTYLLDSKVIHGGDGTITLIPPNFVHQLMVHDETTYERFFVYFRLPILRGFIEMAPNAFGPLLGTLQNGPFSVRLSGRKMDKFVDLLSDLNALVHRSSVNWQGMRERMLLVELLILMSDHYVSHQKSSNRLTEQYSENFKAMTGYLRDHAAESLTLDRISDHFYTSGATINRTFKREIDMTPKQYLTYVRINASLPYIEAGEPIKMVANRVGYKNESSFIRTFSSLKAMTPKQYFKRVSRKEREM